MTDDLLTLADRLFTGEADIGEHHPFRAAGGFALVGEGTGFVAAFANAAAFATPDGLVMVDTSSSFHAPVVHERVRAWRPDDPLHTAVFTHGHVDHCFGVELYEADAERRGWPAPRVVAHEAVPARFDRYRRTAGYNALINQRQFALPRPWWPTQFRRPDRTYRDRLVLDVGGERFDLHHARGETDDHTWVHVPERRVLCTGDLIIWASPNCGNPQKVQRYPAEWAAALRTMAELRPEVLLPGHGLPVLGEERVRTVLTDTAELLEHLVDETLALMNTGARLDEIVETVQAPEHLLARPWLQPIYDEPEFVVRNLWRLYGGWWDGDPAHLKPAPAARLAAELAELAGGAGRLAERAEELAAAGDLRLAGHLAELAAQATPGDPGVQRARAAVFAARAAAERSTMAIGVFRWAATEAERAAEAGTPDGSGDGPEAVGSGAAGR
jgi:alkyl sulfatase BDS1-like metallo-beta-lactamase superfamily hydrolase